MSMSRRLGAARDVATLRVAARGALSCAAGALRLVASRNGAEELPRRRWHAPGAAPHSERPATRAARGRTLRAPSPPRAENTPPAPAPAPTLAQMMPVCVTTLTPLMVKYGFAPNQMGMMQLALAGQPYKDDEEIVMLGRAMREKVIPAELQPMLNAMMGMQLPGMPPMGFPGMPGMPGMPGPPPAAAVPAAVPPPPSAVQPPSEASNGAGGV